MTRAASYEDAVLRVHAYVDGELDPANALSVEASMAADAALAAERERIEVFRRLVRQHLPQEEPPLGLRARVEAAVGMRRPRIQPSWRVARGIDCRHRSRRKWCNINASCAIREQCGTRGHRRRSHQVADGIPADRRCLFGPPHREALVQWPSRPITSGRRSWWGFPFGRWAHRRSGRHSSIDTGLPSRQTSHRPDGRAGGRPRELGAHADRGCRIQRRPLDRG